MTNAQMKGSGTGAALVIGGGLVFVGSLALFVVQLTAAFGRYAGPWSWSAALGPVTADVLLFTAFAMHHSVFARTGLKRALTAFLPSHYERTLYVWVSSLLFAAVTVWWQPVPGLVWQVASPWSWGFAVIQAAGGLMTLEAARRLDVLELSGLRQGLQLGGRPQGPLLSTGLYGVVRHPIYFGWVLLVWVTPVMTGTRLAFAVISTLYLAAAIPFEERSLRELFGEGYDAYARKVRWKMVPGVY
jgi:methanethiol S-methyltransferase